MHQYGRTEPDSDIIEFAQTIAEECGNRGYCIICGCPMYGRCRDGIWQMACMPGYTHLCDECKKMDKSNVIYETSHINMRLLEKLLTHDTTDSETPNADAEPREPKELTDPSDNEVKRYFSESLALFERFALHSVASFPFSDGKKLLDYLLSSHTMAEFCENYSWYHVNQRVIAAEPVRYSREDRWIQYVLRFAANDGPKQFRFIAVYDDVHALERHIKMLFDANGNRKHDLVYVCADWTFTGTPNTPISSDHWHCCAYCRVPDSVDPGCAYDECVCMGVYIGQMVNPGRQMRIIKKYTPITKNNRRRNR